MAGKISLDTDVEPQLQERDKVALVTIVEFIKNDRFHRPPSHSQLLDEMNKVLPKQKGGKLALISKEQTNRMASRLRREKLLEELEPGSHLNLIPTPLGERWARQWHQESVVTRKSKGRSSD